jgi:hypothetical protein
MKKLLYSVVICAALAMACPAQTIPRELWGSWTITRAMPTTTIGCWGKAEAKKLIGTQIEYSSDIFRWKSVVTRNPKADVTTVSAEQFQQENSGGGGQDSQVTFRQLGITAESAKQVTIQHVDADITGGTTEIPGDRVWLKDQRTIVFAVCNSYFEARKISAPKHKAAQ